MTKRSNVYSATIKVSTERDSEYDKYNNLVDSGESRVLGDLKISADSLEALKKRLHSHIDLLE